MASILLTIDHRDALGAAKRDQRRQRDFGRIGLMRKHGFTKHHLAQVNAVEAAGKLAIDPGFHAVRMTRVVQVQVGALHVRHDPGARLARSGLVGAGADDALESAVNPDFAFRIVDEMNEAFTQ